MNKLKALRNKIKNNKGFSLVELIVVIVILAILIGVTIGGIYSYVNKSRINTDINNAASIQSVLAAVATDADVNKVFKKGPYAIIDWDDAKKNIADATVRVEGGLFVDGKFSKTSTAENNATKTAVLEKISELLTDGLPAPKAGGSFSIKISKNVYGNIEASCKAYSTKGPDDHYVLKPES